MYAPASSGVSVPGVPGSGTATSPIGPFSPYGQPVSSPLFDFTPSRAYGGLPRSTGPWNEPGGYYGGNPYQTPPDDAAYRYDPRQSIYGLVPFDFTREDVTGGDYSGTPGGSGNPNDGGGSLPDGGGNGGSSWWFWQDYLRRGLEEGEYPDGSDPNPSIPKDETGEKDPWRISTPTFKYGKAYDKYRSMGGTMGPEKFYSLIYDVYGYNPEMWFYGKYGSGGDAGGSTYPVGGGTTPTPDDPGPYDKYGYKDPYPRDDIKTVDEPVTDTGAMQTTNSPIVGGLAPAAPKYGNWGRYEALGPEGTSALRALYTKVGYDEAALRDLLAENYKQTWGSYPEGYTP